MTKLPLLVSVPHGSERIPEEVSGYCLLTAEQIRQDGDEGASEIYDFPDLVQAWRAADVARAIVDLNRPEEDRRADGVVKTHTCMNVPVYDPFPPEDVVERLLERYHRPYHRDLTALARSGVRLGIDCHTMLAVGPPMGPMAGEERPRICLSDADGTTCPESWFDALAGSLEEAFEVRVSRNLPFKGGHITRSHAKELPWVQLELSRSPFLSGAQKRERVVRALEAFCAAAGLL